MSLIDKIKKNNTLKNIKVDVISKSAFMGKTDFVRTPVPMLNVALSGKLDGGFSKGIIQLAGPSKHYKSNFAFLMAAAFQRQYSDGIILFYDSEYGVTQKYLDNFGIDSERVVHVPLKHIEELKFDLIAQLEGFEQKDNVLILLDSLGNLASKAELEAALNEKGTIDMQRAKQLKSIFRMATPYLSQKNIPMIIINHTYDDMEGWGGQKVSGGTGAYYSSDTIFVIGRSQEKNSKGLRGYNFNINIEKSRFVKEKSKIPITVLFEGGIDTFSGLIELAEEGGFIKRVGESHIRTFLNETDKEKVFIKGAKEEVKRTWWTKVLQHKPFKEFIENKYQLTFVSALEDYEVSEEEYIELIKEELVEELVEEIGEEVNINPMTGEITTEDTDVNETDTPWVEENATA